MKKSMDALESIRTCMNDYTCGWRYAEALTVIAKAVSEIRVEAGSHDYVREKLGSLNGWADKLYSSWKHAPWGIEMVRHFILCDCDGVKTYLERIRKEAS
jgi:hypothetical protein